MQELLTQLRKQLAIDEQQARTGAAILFKAARDKLGDDEFQRVLGGLPGLADLLRQAPANNGGLLGSIAAALGGGNAAILAGIVSGFGKLGLTPEMAKRFVPIIGDFLHKHVGPDVVAEIEGALRS
jgi:hypothetical protein